MQRDIETGSASFYTHTDEEGKYTISGLAYGGYYLHFIDPADTYSAQYNGDVHFLGDASPVSLTDEGSLHTVDSNMPKARTIQGSIMLDNGLPATSYMVVLEQQKGDELVRIAEGATDAYGAFELQYSDMGSYQLVIYGPSYDDGTLQTADLSLLYASEISIGVSGPPVVGQGNVILLEAASPNALPEAEEPQIVPNIFIPFTVN